jgi:hypothetical protein
MYLRIKNEEIIYPYSISQLKLDESNVSFPKNLSKEDLENWGVYEVKRTPKNNDYTQDAIETIPELIDGVYTQIWGYTSATQDEIDFRINEKWLEVRELRNQLLTESDWTQLSDIPLEIKEKWTNYRKDLRDITKQENPFYIIWPILP